MIGVNPPIQIKKSHSFKMWIILEVGAHILSDQCLNQEVENTSVMPCLLALFLFLLMLKQRREKKVDTSSSTKDESKTIQLERIADLVQPGKIYSLQIEALNWM
jgi:hypothetical protein